MLHLSGKGPDWRCGVEANIEVCKYAPVVFSVLYGLSTREDDMASLVVAEALCNIARIAIYLYA